MDRAAGRRAGGGQEVRFPALYSLEAPRIAEAERKNNRACVWFSSDEWTRDPRAFVFLRRLTVGFRADLWSF